MPIVYSKERDQWSLEGSDPDELQMIAEIGAEEFTKKFAHALFRKLASQNQQVAILNDMPADDMGQA